MNEAETRAEHIDPALKAAGWGVVDASRIHREFPLPRNADHQIGVSNAAAWAHSRHSEPPAELPTDPRWHSRGYLPHFDSPGVVQHITFHLADSLATDAIKAIESEIRLVPEPQRDPERRKCLEAWIDAGHGSCVFRNSAIARLMQSSLLNADGHRYRLLAWVVMPNHVHALIKPVNGWTVAKIVATWKKFSARQINDHLSAHRHRRLQPFWHREYWDRFMRDEQHLQRTIAYIHNNPVKSGLVASPEQWPWSSAFPGNAEHQFGEKHADPAIGAPDKA